MWIFSRFSLSSDLLRIPANTKLTDVREANFIEESEIVFWSIIEHGLRRQKIILDHRSGSLTLGSDVSR